MTYGNVMRKKKKLKKKLELADFYSVEVKQQYVFGHVCLGKKKPKTQKEILGIQEEVVTVRQILPLQTLHTSKHSNVKIRDQNCNITI